MTKEILMREGEVPSIANKESCEASQIWRSANRKSNKIGEVPRLKRKSKLEKCQGQWNEPL